MPCPRAILRLLASLVLLLAPIARATAADAPAAPALNHLAGQSSPYLLAHQTNPVDWYPWGAAAFAKAAAEDKPVFLSIGYDTCHWCHVMAQESFADPAVAAVLNAHFVAIKIDREELPQVDAYYGAFVAASGRPAGWPLCVFCTADRTPFFGTTYLPKAQLLTALGVVVANWGTKRAALIAPGQAVQADLRASIAPPAASADRARLNAQALSQIARRYDELDGGFGAAPKFPLPGLLGYLLGQGRDTPYQAMAVTTLRRMAEGGICDQLEGGFHRYTLDAAWRVPHFEMMLADQAQLSRIYRRAARCSGDADLRAVSRRILAQAGRALGASGGGYEAALDADSLAAADGADAQLHAAGRVAGGTREGAYYVWTMSQVRAALAPLGTDAPSGVRLSSMVYGLADDGNVPAELDSRGDLTGMNVLYRAQPVAQAAAACGLAPEQAHALLTRCDDLLRAARARRPAPAVDRQLLSGWNGLMIGALALAGAEDDDAPALAAATATAQLVMTQAWSPQRGLARVVGGLWHPASASDYAQLEDGLILLHQASGDARLLGWACELQAWLDHDFWDETSGSYLDAPAGAEADVPARLRLDEDGAEPAAGGMIAHNLWYLANALDDHALQARLDRLLATYQHLLAAAPEAMPVMLSAMDLAAAPVRRVLIIGDPSDPSRAALVHATWLQGDEDLIRVILPTERSGIPWLAGHPALLMPARAGHATASYCSGTACQAPTASAAVLATQLAGP